MSNDSQDYIIFQPNYLIEKKDVDTQIADSKFAVKVSETEATDSVEHLQNKSDEYWEAM